MTTRIGVVQFPGTNCELDVMWAVEALGAHAERCWHGDATVRGVDAVVLPGGFAHGDYLRTGALARFSPVMDAVTEFAASGGPVVGICNGFQVLTEARLLPGALQKNAGLKFLCETVELRVETSTTVLTGACEVGQRLRVPINHFEGNYVCDPATLDRLRAEDRVVVRYTDNPNGSLDDVAGICNEARNVVGLMPHPERASDALLGSDDGVVLLRSLLAAAAARVAAVSEPASSYAFGDSALARERLALVADTFEEPTRRLLDDLPPFQPRYVVDMGCGPGHTATLLRGRFPHSEVTGLDASSAMVEAARERVAGWFTVADVTAPLRLPADVVYSRLLLGHLRDPAAVLARWVAAMRPPGLLVCEEPVRYRSDDPLFARYESAVTGVVAARGGRLWAAPVLDADLPGCVRLLDRVVEHPVPAGRAAGMFWRNAVTWSDEVGDAPELVERLRGLERAEPDEQLMWELRQTVVATGLTPFSCCG